MQFLFVVAFLPLITTTPHINLYFTDQFSSNDVIPHHCLRVVAAAHQWNINRQMISYCVRDSLSNYSLNNNENNFPQLTFAELSEANISSEQLYFWSASIDLIEDYQVYLDHISTSSSNDPLLEKTVFYNCSLPRFGSSCQYQFDYYHPNHTSLYEMIWDFYRNLNYDPVEFTCYMHLQCDRRPYSSCLDWSEICDGKIDCHNGAVDEEHCWQLELHECEANEYRCLNGQCIPRSLHLDDPTTPDCLDQSDEPRIQFYLDHKCDGNEPTIVCADTICTDMPLTSSCFPQRTNLLVRTMFFVKDNDISDDCWFAVQCALEVSSSMNSACVDLCHNQHHISIINQTCPDMLFAPAIPILYDELYFAYRKNDTEHHVCGYYWNPYLCASTDRYDGFFSDIPKVILNNRTCWQSSDILYPGYQLIVPWIYAYAIPHHLFFQKYSLLRNYSSNMCNESSMYQCLHSSKCISIHRLMNNVDDCPYRDDEDINKNQNPYAIEQMKRNSFYCLGKKKYVPLTTIEDGKCDCGYVERDWCEDESLQMNYIRRNISFQTICDGYIELQPILLDGHNETDETQCDQWPCDNIYTHCDGLWNCPKGEDEIGCYRSSSLTCAFDEHFCVSIQTLELICLALDKVNDGRIDCIGATDERRFCHRNKPLLETNKFYCITNRSTECLEDYYLCNRKNDCLNGDDERFCQQNRSSSRSKYLCRMFNSFNRTDVEQFLCDSTTIKSKQRIVHFALNQSEKSLVVNQQIDTTYIVPSFKSWIEPLQMQNLICHRGLDLRMWFDNKKKTICLCPPSYYGDRCQYQNQRISLSLQFRVSSHSHQMPFAILISLIDNDDRRIIHSYEQITYLSMRDCRMKFSVYLLYSSRPKSANKEYSIKIDIYEKISLDYRGSLLIPVQFSFLPVHRLSFLVDIPSDNTENEPCSIDECHHGTCFRYSHNRNNLTFCQCHRGWSGRSCTIRHTCQCASDAVCLGIDANNQPVCVCPLHRFGPRCYLRHTSCSLTNETCQNNGQCIPNDELSPSNAQWTCICPRGYIGRYCEIIENQIVLSFARDILSSQSVFIHFIQSLNIDSPRRATTLHTISFRQQSLRIHWSQPFHLVFVEFPHHKYYFALAQTIYNQSTVIEKPINSSHRCQHIRELFNETIVQLHLLRRIKFYQLPCQIHRSNLSCFYDDIHLCLCQDHRRQRVANCFQFNHNMTFNCLGQSICENNAQCFQDAPSCPRRSTCVCPACYYGFRCQFSTTIFSLSLDAILGYHIQANLTMIKQPSIVQISVGLTVIYILIGLINGIVALMTFKNKMTRHVGCGYYLLAISITTLVITSMFGLKFWILLLAQMQLINNRSFLSLQCHSVDFLLRCSLNMDQWLSACVAVERAVTILQGTRFNKARSKRIAKWIICLLAIFILLTGLDDPIHRRLIDEDNDDEQERIWCVVSYSSFFRTFNSTMNLFHFLTPFLLNLLSAVILITQKSRRKATLVNDRSYKELLREEFRQHKHLLIAPVVLVILALPQLIFSFASKCMKSNDSSWLFLAGYFISFVPPMLTVILFIVPSELYKKELRSTITRYRRNVTQGVNALSFRSTTLN